MASREEIKRTILKVAGDPETGVIKELADELADAIAGLDAKPTPGKVQTETDGDRLAKETRVTEPSETR